MRSLLELFRRLEQPLRHLDVFWLLFHATQHSFQMIWPVHTYKLLAGYFGRIFIQICKSRFLRKVQIWLGGFCHLISDGEVIDKGESKVLFLPELLLILILFLFQYLGSSFQA